MSGYYALIASLPMLKLDEPAYMGIEDFTAACSSALSETDFLQLQRITLNTPPEKLEKGTLARMYAEWDAALRNAIARHRATVRKINCQPYINQDFSIDCETEHVAHLAFSAANPLEREHILDNARWAKAEELKAGEHFSFDSVCAYKIQLLLQKKWLNRNARMQNTNLDNAVKTITQGDNA